MSIIEGILVDGAPTDKEDMRAYLAARCENQPYVISITWNGSLPAGQVLLRHKFDQTVVFPTALAGSQADAEDNATSDATLSIEKNGVEVGTLVFDGGTETVTFAMASEQTFVSGDLMKIIGPSPPDATLADLAITIKGART